MALTNGANPLSVQPVYSSQGTRSYTGADGDYMDAGHHAGLELGSGTISLSFSVASLPGDKALISKDGSGREDGGHFTVWVKDGTLLVTQESATGTEYLKVPDFVLAANQTYHLGLSFGDRGLMVWLDGELVAAEPEFKQGLEANDRSLVIGGTRAWRDSDSQSAHTLFEGEIGNVMVFGGQLGGNQMRALANAVDPALDSAASMASGLENLLPLLGDMHHGSDTLTEILTAHGVTAHGHFAVMPDMKHGSNNGETLSGTSGRDGINAWAGDDSVAAQGGDDVVQGGYGNDTLDGGGGNDILDGGHGEDSLTGGAGDDLLISRADGREGEIFYDPNRDEGDPYGELTNGKLYPDQPIPADDVLEGGSGADIFYFQTLINAKQRYIEKHTRDDGSINWHGVAGENDKLHDHWVDIMGHDVIRDFDRAEGDRIVIEGHTTQIASITYGDVNGDGIMDHSVIELYSDQGKNGGAHNDDRLGTITVYGDLVKKSDIEHTAKPAYGIIHTIDDLAKALAPRSAGTEAGPIAPPASLPTAGSLNLANLPNPVFAMTGNTAFTGADGDYMDAGHHAGLELGSGTISLSFSVASLPGDKALISKDGSGREDGGHFTVWVKDGTLLVTQESATGTEYLKVPDFVLAANQTYHLGLSFGDRGLMVWLDGELVAAEPEFKQGLEANDRSLVIGGTRAWRDSDSQSAHTLFEGEIGNVMVFGGQLGGNQMRALANAVDPALDSAASMASGLENLLPLLGDMHHGSDTLTEILTAHGVTAHGHFAVMPDMKHGSNNGETLSGTSGRDGINAWAGDDSVAAQGGDDVVQGGYGNDTLDGGGGNDILDGGHGEDSLTGGAGDDLLISRADGREGEIFYDPNRDEGDPYGELTNGKLYPDQPIPADDVLEGGSGADIFYFQTLINAKQRYIEKHTRDDGSINWHGVAGENDKLHDHWVDIMGHDVIRDFDRAEGDRIVIEGHTTQIASITYGDVNGDGIMDHSVIELYSDQGKNGGAHNDDRLGTITVYGDLVKKSDIEHTAKPAYGIIHTIDDLAKALAPRSAGTEAGPIAPPASLPTAGSLNLANLPNPVFAMTGTQTFVSEERAPMIFDHSGRFDLVEGTIAFNFEITELEGYQVLFSKDAEGYGNGGHVSAYLDDKGNLTVRVQDLDESFYLKAQLGLMAGQSHDFAMTFGENGVELLLDGARVAFDADIVYDMTGNTEALIVGASGWSNTAGQTDRIHSHFNGKISNFVVFGTPLSAAELKDLDLSPGATGQLDNTGSSARGMTLLGTDGADHLSGGDGGDTVSAGAGDDRVFGQAGDDMIAAEDGHDSVIGGDGNDMIDGAGGNDRLWAGLGDDTVFGGDGSDQIGVSDGNDNVWAGAGNDSVYGGLGNDEIGGSDGNDIIFSAEGNDSVYGGSGNDTLWAGVGDDLVRASDGDDVVHGLDGMDTIWTGGGNDTLDAGDGDDIMGAYHGNDELWAGGGNDTVYAGEGHDLAHGEDGDDQIYGVGGNDTLTGGAGDDHIRGGDGDDRIHGNAGIDRLDGQAGDDVLSGGTDADVFVFSTGQDRVLDFDVSQAGEQIDLSRANSIADYADLLANWVSQTATGDAVISDAFGNTMVLQGIAIGSLAEDDFIF